MKNNSVYRQACTITGALIIVLMMLHIPLWGPFYAEDLLAPVVLALLVLGGDFKEYLKGSGLWLALFVAWAGIMSLAHIVMGGWEDGYNFCVLLYLAGLFCFFRRISLPSRLCVVIGGGFLAVVLASWLAGFFFPSVSCPPFGGFWLVTENASQSAMSFLTKRFQFTFGNPNSLGSFYPLPVILLVSALMSSLNDASEKSKRRMLWLCLAALVLSLLPLCHTFSKHAILTGAVLLAFVCIVLPKHWRKALQYAWLLVVVIGLICETTVLWSTFPLSSKPPFINSVPGGYTIHQKAYARMSAESLVTFLTGRTMADIRTAYPAHAERERARKILAQYNAEHLLDGFCRFMDPHNEYLNLLAFYGIGAVALAVVFFWRYAREIHSPLAAYFLLALAFCCLWDDLMSKRWIWLAAACLGNLNLFKENTHDESHLC